MITEVFFSDFGYTLTFITAKKKKKEKRKRICSRMNTVLVKDKIRISRLMKPSIC